MLVGIDATAGYFTLIALTEEGRTLLLLSSRVPSMSRASNRISLVHLACLLDVPALIVILQQ